MENKNVASKWYDKKIIVVLLCIFFFPVGLYGLWKSNVIHKGWKIGYTIFIFILFVLAQAAKDQKQEKTTNNIKPDSEIAYVIAQNYISISLKSPSTADFPALDYHYSMPDSVTYIISSYVDSQNGFGAMIRTNYKITLRYNGGETGNPQNWTVIDLKEE